ncbi:MAG: class I SAM-dependent methyltransferase, partial [Chloroflexi bacterium]|nr:class I SAM-dependent methyltransferase [Chloroflexota bacterium]
MNRAEYARMDEAEVSGWWFAGKRLFLRAVMQRAGVDLSVGRLLDAGCGTGATLRSVRPAALDPSGFVPEAWGLDMSAEALHFASQKCGAGLVCGSAEALPFADRTFQTVLLLDVLEHLDDDRKGAAEALRVLVPGGCLAVTVPAYPSLWSDHDVALHHRRRYVRRQINTLLRDAGFHVLYLGHAYASVLPIVAAVRLARRVSSAHCRTANSVPCADLGDVHPFLNSLLLNVMRLESRILERRTLPFGSSILAIAQRPCVA